MSVDPENAGAKTSDPQSWNAYAYTRNNPLKYTDPDGRLYVICNDEGNCFNLLDNDFNSNFWLNPDINKAEGSTIGFGSFTWNDLNWNYRQLYIDADQDPAQDASFDIVTELLPAVKYGKLITELGLSGAIRKILFSKLSSNTLSSAKGKVRFGKNANQEYHAFRHVKRAGINKKAAENAIRTDIASKEINLKPGQNIGSVNIDGKTLEYNAFKLPDGTINVGRITVK